MEKYRDVNGVRIRYNVAFRGYVAKDPDTFRVINGSESWSKGRCRDAAVVFGVQFPLVVPNVKIISRTSLEGVR